MAQQLFGDHQPVDLPEGSDVYSWYPDIEPGMLLVWEDSSIVAVIDHHGLLHKLGLVGGLDVHYVYDDNEQPVAVDTGDTLIRLPERPEQTQ